MIPEGFEDALYDFVDELYESHIGDGEKDGQIDYFLIEKWKHRLYNLAHDAGGSKEGPGM